MAQESAFLTSSWVSHTWRTTVLGPSLPAIFPIPPKTGTEVWHCSELMSPAWGSGSLCWLVAVMWLSVQALSACHPRSSWFLLWFCPWAPSLLLFPLEPPLPP